MEHFPEHRELWDHSLPIQRADIGRLMILLVYGGAYADLDTRPARPLDVMLDTAGFRRYSHNAVICIEDEKTPAMMRLTARWHIRQMMANVGDNIDGERRKQGEAFISSRNFRSLLPPVGHARVPHSRLELLYVGGTPVTICARSVGPHRQGANTNLGLTRLHTLTA
jgi:hypothetical protein